MFRQTVAITHPSITRGISIWLYRSMMEDNPDLRFVIPKEGSNIFTDAMCIPREAKNKELAEMYINFMLEPEVGLAAWRRGFCSFSSWVARSNCSVLSALMG